MSAKSTKGLTIWLQDTDAALVVKTGPLEFTAVTNDNPTVITVDDSSGMAVGDAISFSNTGVPALDRHSGIITEINSTDISVNIDSSDETVVFVPSDEASLTVTPMTEMTSICAYDIAVDANTPGTISVGTFCDPSASIPSIVNEAGNLTLSVYHDPSDLGFRLLNEAYQEGDDRTLVIKFAQDGGWLIATGVVSGFDLSDVPLDGAAAWQATFALNSKPELVY